ncbi:AAA family ATPase [Marinobacterium litorale]|uniref:AAA family ATPase n=1 Tax=Marinobacterium litorale TaxID=404770 RepID=UPI00041B0836|nr:AAA family ATPase [Marinobacterium litorale]
MSIDINDHLVLLCGKSAAGKSASLRKIRNPEGVLYLNCESGKRLPFRSGFIEKTVTDPLQIEEAFIWAESQPHVHTIIVDSLTYLMDMYESLYVLPSTNTMKAWGEFSQYFKRLMQTHVAKSTKKVVFTAHTLDSLNEGEMVMETKVPVKGSLKNNGIESYFSCVIAAKKMKVKELGTYGSSLLNIEPEESALGYKYVFQTKLTKETVNERLRGPMGLFSTEETFIDNDIQQVFDRLDEYYGTGTAAA